MTADARSNYERERRFLVSDQSIVAGWSSVLITQAYLWAKDGYAARVRLIQQENGESGPVDLDATYAIKGPRIGDERFEAESRLPDFEVARAIIDRCDNVVIKRRYQIIDREAWDVDVFLGKNAGLVIAELEGADVRGVRRPEWCSEEITTKDRYNNETLAFRPYSPSEETQGRPSTWP